MAKERLSKLQKWILIECYMNPRKKYRLDFDENGNPKRDEKGEFIRITYKTDGIIWREHILGLKLERILL